MTTGEKEQGLLSSDSSACRFLFCCFNRGGRFVFIGGAAASAAARRRKRGILSGSHCCERIRAVSSSSKKKRGSGLSFSGSPGLLPTYKHRRSPAFCFPTSAASTIA
ncbi:hypothetical protein MRB53_021304 [Persea americana]|uniref:Uncharacterized protein n=1 Tax=Persea americana TaxID=3435 RepID=A0ACC2L3R2_PERAE|nr:hypothetical protein MRB53_021304 [Persea americana]